MYTKTVFVPCTIGAICLHFFSGEQRQVESKMGPLGVCLSFYAYFELAFARLKNKKAPLLQATVIVSRTL